MENFDVENVYKHLKKLNYPRFVDTENEKKAASYISEKFSETGLEVTEETFNYSKSLKILKKVGHLFQALSFLLAGYLLRTNPKISLVIAVGLLVSLIVTTRWSRFISTKLNKDKKNTGKNIIASRRVSETAKKLVFMAHYDTKSELLPMKARILLLTISIIGGIIFSFTIITSSALSSFTRLTVPYQYLLYSGLFLFLTTIPLAFNKTGNKSPGIIDNATSVAIMLELARTLQNNNLNNIDVSFVATGAEEVGLKGSISYMKEHIDDLEEGNVYIVNLDLLGTGDVVYNSGYGFPVAKTSTYLNQLLKDIGRENGTEIDRHYFPTGLAADHMPYVEKGYQATWLLSKMPKVHTKNDAMENLDKENIETSGKILQQLMYRIDNESSL